MKKKGGRGFQIKSYFWIKKIKGPSFIIQLVNVQVVVIGIEKT